MTRTFLPGGTYRLNLRPGESWDFEVASETLATGDVAIRLRARGSGVHHLQLRAENLTFGGDEKEVVLKGEGAATLEWRGRITEKETPWVAVVVPDGDLSQRQEIMGAALAAQ
jgi:hypothetical protein